MSERMNVSDECRAELFRLLDATASEVMETRNAYREARNKMHLQYDLCCIFATHLRKQGVDAQSPEPPPRQFGVRKTRRLAAQDARAGEGRT